jgi:tRNA (cmo5U34)-methyltransferase
VPLKARALGVLPFLLLREALARSRAERTPEPMVMDEPDSVAQFHVSGGVDGLNTPVYELNARAASRLTPAGGTVLDLGSGSGQYLAHLARRRPDLHIVGIDLSEPMLATGREMLAREGLAARVTLQRGDITDLEDVVPHSVDLVSCVFALHHLPDEDALGACLGEIARVRRRTGCAVLIFDFARLRHPRSYTTFFSLLPEQGPVLTRDALASERAAFSVDELRRGLVEAELADLSDARTRPFRAYQLHWCARGTGIPDGQSNWIDLPLPKAVRRDWKVLEATFSGLPPKRP